MNESFNRPITTRNLIDIIDDTVLELKSLKVGGALNESSSLQILEVLKFLKNVTSETFTNLLFDKAIFIEEKPLQSLHNEMQTVHINKDNIENLINLIQKINTLNATQINGIQHHLIEVSMPLWNVLKSKNL